MGHAGDHGSEARELLGLDQLILQLLLFGNIPDDKADLLPFASPNGHREQPVAKDSLLRFELAVIR